MRVLSIYTVAALALSGCLASAATVMAADKTLNKPIAADTVIKGASIYTLDAVRSWAQAVALSKGKIVYVGTDAGVQQFIDGNTKVISMHGEMVLPGLHDCHIHPLSGAIEREGIDLSTCNTPEEIAQSVKSFADKNPVAKWIAGAGWRSPIFPDANPHKDLLDKVVPDRPVYLLSEDGHSIWVNSKALELAGVTKATKDPTTGTIEHDKDTGEPSGTLREGAAELVSKLLPLPDAAHRLELLKKIQARFNSHGITTVEDACVDQVLLETYSEADRKGVLTLRVKAALATTADEDAPTQLARLTRLRDTVKDCHNVTADTVKIFADGVIESHTAALTQPYVDRPDCTGILNMQPEALTKLVTALDSSGFQIHIHAIGDRAVHSALDAYESAAGSNGKRNMRHQIAHLQLIRPEDRPRFRQLDVIANFQPYWSVADPYMMQQTEPVIGPERSLWQYPINAIAKSGAVVVGGSDWPVTTMNPFDEMEVAVTHKAPGGGGAPWNPDQRVDLPTILAAYTIKGAYACKQEQVTGSIEVGKRADLVVINQNLFEIPAEQIHKTKVLMTILDGVPVYENESVRNSMTASH